MNFMPVGGKNSDSELTGIKVSSEGNIISQKKWQNEVIWILEPTEITLDNQSVFDDAYALPSLDLSDTAAVSLRVINYGTDQPLTLKFHIDDRNNNYYLYRPDGQMLSFTVPMNRTGIIITPDDIPQLYWLSKLRIVIGFPNNTSPTIGGYVGICAVVKR